jgi:SAM-dependent methyltransferase
MSESDQLRASWVANAAAWCDAVRERRIESRRLVTDDAIVQAVLSQRPSTVLDLGCGEGWLARALASHGIAATGVDGSKPLIEAAEALGGARYITATYDDILATPAVVGSGFDVVVANFSLLDDRVEDVLTVLIPALSARGTFVIQTVHPVFAGGERRYADGWQVETFQSFEGDWAESMPWYFRTLESWSRVFATVGLALQEIREPLHPERGVPASIVFICRAEAPPSLDSRRRSR